jgi:hypothetical protein
LALVIFDKFLHRHRQILDTSRGDFFSFFRW